MLIWPGTYLAARRMLNWRIPVAVLASVALLGWGLHQLAPAEYPPRVSCCAPEG